MPNLKTNYKEKEYDKDLNKYSNMVTRAGNDFDMIHTSLKDLNISKEQVDRNKALPEIYQKKHVKSVTDVIKKAQIYQKWALVYSVGESNPCYQDENLAS